MRRRDGLMFLAASLVGCAPTPQQQAAALMPTAAATGTRSRQARRYDTTDRMMLLRAAVGTLQDLGYTIEESQVNYGVIVGSKLGSRRIRVQVVVQETADRHATMVRATFQTILPRPGAMAAAGETISDPEIYRGFFEKLSQSVFLTAHEI